MEVRYLVPDGVGSTLISYGIAKERITELGWWGSTRVHHPCISQEARNHTQLPNLDLEEEDRSPMINVEIPSGTSTAPATNPDPPSSPWSTTFSETTTLNDVHGGEEGISVVATCCPAQHNSGRELNPLARNTSLWGSWYLTIMARGEVLRVYFAG